MKTSSTLFLSLLVFVLTSAAPPCFGSSGPGHGIPDLILSFSAQDDDGWGWGEEEEPPPAEPPKEEPSGEEWGSEEWDEGPGEETAPSSAREDGPEMRGKGAFLSISLWALGALPIGGEAGAGTDAPGWTDAYGFGFGGGGVFALRLLPCLDVRLGAYYQSLPSKSFEAVGVTNELSSFTMFGVGLGVRFFILTDRPVDQWFGKSRKPYVGAAFCLGFDFGIGFSSSVTWDAPAPSWDYWDSGTLIVQEFVLGVEYRFAENIGTFIELGMPTSSGPKGAEGPASPLNDAGSLSAFRFKFGLLFAF